MLGDSVTTDHISPAGSIPPSAPAGRYLIEHGVEPREFNSYGSRRGNHEVMMRGTFANIRLRNGLVPGVEGGVTLHLPDGEQMSIYDAAEQLPAPRACRWSSSRARSTAPASSRDWAAKGTLLLGVRAVIAETYERIHRSNLVGMGVLPLQFLDGDSPASLGLTGHERFTIRGVADIAPRQTVTVEAEADDGTTRTFEVLRSHRRAGRSRLPAPRRHPADGAAPDDRSRAEGRLTRAATFVRLVIGENSLGCSHATGESTCSHE